ncbi:TlpA family protein disulfide reductase [Gordonia hankookensis]|uniref:TlpA family protein disulfide reductase n=1 Tax=Gordonia hankookensis TaxID=589403 RepID=A0ABR7W950_9ACTN|nr:TlpA disulfide reductase family protein [Gordonia hankookensis]MBD1319066.1 TlpA family protein disulfide reductase [Gordonia hankookensis]
MRRFCLLVAVMAALIGVISGCGTGDDAVAQGDTFQFVSPGGQTVITYPPADRKKVADLSGPDLVTDQPLSLSDERFRDKAVVINVWGSWCGPCRGEADDLERVYEQTNGLGVEFLGINLRDDRQSAKDFVADRSVGFPSIYDYDGITLSSLTTPTAVVPTTVVLDRQHRPAAVFLKAVTADELDATVRKVAAESVSTPASAAPGSPAPQSSAPPAPGRP